MNLLRLSATLVPCLFFIASPAPAQGPLTPPGPPAPSMKTLDQTEPRIPIETLPLTITSSGSYYFTRNLQFAAATGGAITVNASNVTIDLMGFTLSSTGAVTGGAISLNGNGCTVRNGSIVGTTTVSISSGSAANRVWTITPGGFAFGIESGGNGHRIVDLTVAKCRGEGVSLGEPNSVLSRCVAHENGGAGLTAGVITECSAFKNGGLGLSAAQNLGGLISGSRSYENKGRGIFANLVSHCMSQSNGAAGINAITIHDSSASFNGGNGIEASNTVTGCTARGNGGHGIRGFFVKDNTATTNGGAGIHFIGDGARIEGNNCFENNWGIQGEPSTDSFIVRNSCKGNSGTPQTPTPPQPPTGDYDFPTSNTYGPIVTVSGDMSANGATSHPWANFRY